MYDCAKIVEKSNIDGAQFLSLSDYEMNRFSIMDRPQLQKIMHDIKKNDSGIMSKFKKFQNEQVALICKTGKNTWDRLTSKPPPSVPPVDYVPDDEEQWSDDFDYSDYENPDDHSDSEVYVVPNGDNGDDSYEPPPSEKENKTLPPAFSFSRGEYADNRSSQQQPRSIAKPLPTLPDQPSSKPKKLLTLPPPTVLKQKIPLKQQECTDNEADYVVPVDDEDEDDNYIEPTEESPSQSVKPPVVNRAIKPTAKADLSSLSVPPPAPVSPSMLDVYEVPEEEEKPSPPLTRNSKPLPPKPDQRPGGYNGIELSKSDVPRNILPLPRNHPQRKVDPDGFDIHGDEGHNNNETQESKFPPGMVPSPLPRMTKKPPNPAILAKPSLPSRDHLTMNEDKPIPAERRRGSNHDLPLPAVPSNLPKPLPQKPPLSLRSPDPVNRILTNPRNSISNTTEQDSSIHGKPWFMASSDRKTAEDALYKSNKDGSFLVRKSSGQDSKQPYTLVVFYNKRVYNIPIRFIESTRQYALGREKSGEERFNSVTEIIENHQQNSLVLIDSQNNTKDSTKLKFITKV